MTRIIIVIILICSYTISNGQKGFVNPAAKYCNILGYEYKIEKNDNGGEVGFCILPNGKKVNAWDFYKGKVGQEFSYPASTDML